MALLWCFIMTYCTRIGSFPKMYWIYVRCQMTFLSCLVITLITRVPDVAVHWLLVNCQRLFLVRFFEKDTLYTFNSSSGLQKSSCIIKLNDFLMIFKSGEFFSALFQYIQNKQLTQQTMLIATSFWIQFNNFYQVLVLKNLILILAVFITKTRWFNTRS